MGVRFKCHHCENELHVKDALAGKRGKCPLCGKSIRIPLADQAYSIKVDDRRASDDAPVVFEEESVSLGDSTVVFDNPNKNDSSSQAAPSSDKTASTVQMTDTVKMTGTIRSTGSQQPPNPDATKSSRASSSKNPNEAPARSLATPLQATSGTPPIPQPLPTPRLAPEAPSQIAAVTPPQSTSHPLPQHGSADDEAMDLFAGNPSKVAAPKWLLERKRKQQQTQLKVMLVLGVMLIILVGLLIWVLFFRDTTPPPTTTTTTTTK